MCKKIVYIIDDDDSVRKSLSALVGVNGFEPRVFESAESFLEYSDENLSGCIVSDVRMGGMNGFEMLKSLNEKGVVVPVILLTGFADSIPQKDAKVLILEKTCGPQVLIESIVAAFEELDLIDESNH